jgi:three-Cys-motif partner protein
MEFFGEQKEQSQIKSEIVKQYFWAWAKIMSCKVDKIAYFDLYAGKGKFDDGTKSTPILVLENALNDSRISQKLVSFFSDTNPEFSESLKIAISEIPDINRLKFKPQVANLTIGEEVVKELKSMILIPTLLFVDPWGYKGLTLELIGSVLKDWGCDCIFFFNYVRINAGIDNDKFDCHIDSIFGKERANELRKILKGRKPKVREELILKTLEGALNQIGGEFVVSYKFLKEKEKRTSHFIIFVSKNVLGYSIMKNIMGEHSSYKYQNVPTFEYNPNPINYGFFPPTPLDDLKIDLLRKFEGLTLSVEEIFFKHNIGTPYLETNYKEALLDLEEKKCIIVNPPSDKRRKIKDKLTMGNKVSITFCKPK